MQKEITVGFIGAGNMGGALAQAVCRTLDPQRVTVSCKTVDEASAVAARLGCRYATAAEVAGQNDFVYLGVKPQMLKEVADELRPVLGPETVLVSMLAGVTLDTLARHFGERQKIIRIMPNTPCAVGSGMIFYCPNAAVSDGETRTFCEQLAAAGCLDALPESQIDAACAVAGCGPAFAYMFIQALADGGVQSGLPRAKAVQYAAQMVRGSADMVLQTGRHPEQLKDDVCSPGGSTIAGVKALESGAFRGTCMEAVAAALAKTKALG